MAREVKLTSVELKPGQQEQLADLAFRLGFVAKTGPGAGRIGSVSQLMQAIANGQIECTKVDAKDD